MTHRTALEGAQRTINFYRSVIKSGEAWSETCEKEYEATVALVKAALAEKDEVERLREALHIEPEDGLLLSVEAVVRSRDTLEMSFKAERERAEAAEARVKELEGALEYERSEKHLALAGVPQKDRALLTEHALREKAESQLALPVAGEVEEVADALTNYSAGARNWSEKKHEHIADAQWLLSLGDTAERAAALLRRFGRVPKLETTWHSPYETPETKGNARQVLVWMERRDNPPELNAPGRMGFGHRIVNPDNNPHWPDNGWFIQGGDDYRVAAWAYADPPDLSHISADGATEVEKIDNKPTLVAELAERLEHPARITLHGGEPPILDERIVVPDMRRAAAILRRMDGHDG